MCVHREKDFLLEKGVTMNEKSSFNVEIDGLIAYYHRESQLHTTQIDRMI